MKSALEMVREVQEYEEKKKAREKARVELLENARKGKVELGFWKRRKLKALAQEMQAQMKYVHDSRFNFQLSMNKHDDEYHFWNNYCAFYLEQHGYLDVEVYDEKIGDRWWGLRIKGRLPKSAAEQVLFGTMNR